MAIDYRKDVDGFHPMQRGTMVIGLPSVLFPQLRPES